MFLNFSFIGVWSDERNTTTRLENHTKIIDDTARLPNEYISSRSSPINKGHQNPGKQHIQLIIADSSQPPNTDASHLKNTTTNVKTNKTEETIGISFFIGKKDQPEAIVKEQGNLTVSAVSSSRNSSNIALLVNASRNGSFSLNNGTKKATELYFHNNNAHNATMFKTPPSETVANKTTPGTPHFYLDFDKLRNKIRKQSSTVKSKWKSYLSKLIKDIDAYKRTLSSASSHSSVSSTNKMYQQTDERKSFQKKKDYIVEVDEDGEDNDNQDDESEALEDSREPQSNRNEGIVEEQPSFRSQLSNLFSSSNSNDDDDSDNNQLELQEILRSHLRNHHKPRLYHHRNNNYNKLQGLLTSLSRFLNHRGGRHHHRKARRYEQDGGFNGMLVATSMPVDGDNYGNQDLNENAESNNVPSEPYDLDEGFISGNRRRLGQKLFGLSPARLPHPSSSYSPYYQLAEKEDTTEMPQSERLNESYDSKSDLPKALFDLTAMTNRGVIGYQQVPNYDDDHDDEVQSQQGATDQSDGTPIGRDNVLWRDPKTNQLYALQEETDRKRKSVLHRPFDNNNSR